MMKFKIASVDSIIIYFSNQINYATSFQVRNAYHCIKNQKFDFLVELIPSYTSLLVRFNLHKTDYTRVKQQLKKILQNIDNLPIDNSSKIISIPVFYDIKVGFDLEDVANFHNLSVDEVIQKHIQKEYFVYAIGFLPGFAYMGEVDKSIITPRISNPRVKVPKGSVAIAENQTAIYPKQSPGGWRILGKSPIEMFHLDYDGFSYIKVGDTVRFIPIDEQEFIRLGGVL